MKKKYIIDLNPDCVEGEYLRIPARIAGEEQWLVTKAALTPYTEPDLEQVRNESFKNGYDTACKDIDIKSKINAAYRKGLEDAWECARKIANMPYGQEEKVFGSGGWKFIINHTASEAIEKIRQYEQEKDAEIKIGNEVKAFEKKPFIVTGFGYGDDEEDVYCHGFVTENGISTSAKKNSCVRTGRHFPEIAEIFEKMRGEQDAEKQK